MKMLYLNPIQRFTQLFLPALLVIALHSCKGVKVHSSFPKKNTPVSSDQLQQLKNRTVIFFVPDNEISYLQDYQQLLAETWTLTPIKVIKYSELSSYPENSEKYAYFTLNWLITSSRGGHVGAASSISYSNSHYYLTLSIPHVAHRKKKTWIENDYLCRIELYPEMGAMASRTPNIVEGLYKYATIRNFTLPYMLAYVKFVQQNLEKGNNPGVYVNYKNKDLMSQLKDQTLYVPDNLIFSRNKFNGKEALKDQDLFEGYKGKYKYISSSDLIKIIKDKKAAPLYLFEYVLSSTDKYVGVLEINSGTVAYRKYTPLSYNLKPKDIKAIID